MYLVLLELSKKELEEFRGVVSVAIENAAPPFERSFIEKLLDAVNDAEENGDSV